MTPPSRQPGYVLPPEQAGPERPERPESGVTALEAAGMEQIEQLLSTSYAATKLSGNQPAGAAAALRSRTLGPVRLDRIAIGADFTADIAPSGALMFPHPREGVVRDPKRDQGYTSGDVHFGVQPDESVRLDYQQLTADAIVVDPAALSEFLGEPATGGRQVQFMSSARARPDDGPRFERLFDYLWTCAARPSSPLVTGAATRLLLATMLNILPNTNEITPTPGEGGDAHPAALQRAIAFIENNAERDVSLADIASAARVSTRTLQLAFRRHLDTTPTAYQRAVRLHHAHRDLLTGDPHDMTVDMVAARWGFADLPRFTRAYEHQFAETPAATLRR